MPFPKGIWRNEYEVVIAKIFYFFYKEGAK